MDQTPAYQGSTLLLVGSGAVEWTEGGDSGSSWGLVGRALHREYAHRPVMTPNNCGIALACLAYRRRWYHAVSKEREEDRIKYQRDLQVTDQEYTDVVNAIKKELATAETQGTLKLRKEFQRVDQRHIVEPFHVVTTNWDTCLDKFYERRAQVVHLHGSTLDSQLFLLPTEVVNEPYRTKDTRAQLAARRSHVISLVTQCKKLVIYGLALSTDDADLTVTVCDSLRHPAPEVQGKQEILVVDTNATPVVERLKFFTPWANVRAIHPDDA